MRRIGRREVIDQLGVWSSGGITPVDMHKWAADLLSSGELEFEDLEGRQGFSAAREALSELEMLDMNMIIESDIPIFVEFLSSPAGGFEKSYIQFVYALQQIDRKERCRRLRNVEPYARHCR